MDHIQIRGKRVNIKKLVFAIAILIVFVFLLVKFVPDISKIASLNEGSFEDTARTGIASAGMGGTASSLSAGGSSSETTESLFTEKKIINRANFQIEVEDYDVAYNKIISFATDVGGYVSDSKIEVSDKGVKNGFINIRIPADKFYNVLPNVETLGKIEERVISGEDVSEKYVDIQSRLENAKKQEQRFLEILQKAENVEEILKVEQELNRIREQIEIYTGQIRYMDNLVALSTIIVRLHEPKALVETSSLWDKLIQTIKQIINAFLNSIKAILIWFAAWLPYFIILSIFYLIYRKNKKKIGDFFSK